MQHTYGIWEIPTEVLLREETTGRLNYRWESNIKIALQGREFGGLDCTQLAQDRDRGTE